MSRASDLKSLKDISEDLSLINGLPNKINADYIKNVQQLILYRAYEQRLCGKNHIELDIPSIGVLSITVSKSKSSNLNIKPHDLSYSFVPHGVFLQNIIKILNNDGFDLPELLANKYGDRILKAYNELL